MATTDTTQVREWALAYGQWNRSAPNERPEPAPLEQKLTEFVQLCAAVDLIAPLKSNVHIIRQLRDHGRERERIVQFEARRKHASCR